MRLAGHDGLSAVGNRPGAPALALALAGTLHLSEVQTVAALEGMLGLAIGLASAALARAAGVGRSTWVLAGVLTGTFAVHLAAGYLSNLAFTAAFIAAAALLAEGTRRAGVAAAGLLGAGGLAHPLFFVLGAAILLLTAAFAWRRERTEALLVGGAVLGGGAVAGIGLLAVLIGPGPLAVDTSKDGFLRRAGLTSELRHAYLDRLVHRWTRYVQWASIPLAIAGLRGARGFVGRFLRAWGIVTIIGVAISVASGLAPADRFITFGFVVPILAAFGLVRLWRALDRRRWLAVAATGGLVLAMLAGSWIAWARQEPFMTPLEVARASEAGAILAGTPRPALVFVVNGEGPAITFLASRAANVIRASVPPDRIRDVVVLVPPLDGPEVPPVREALSRVSLADVRAAVAERAGHRLDVLLAPFDRVDLRETAAATSGWVRIGRGVFFRPSTAEEPVRPTPSEPLRPSSPTGIAVATLGVLVLLVAAGYGWSRAAAPDAIGAAALSPAFGAAALTIGAIALERLGVPLTGTAGPVAISAVSGLGGYLAWFVLQRRARASSAP